MKAVLDMVPQTDRVDGRSILSGELDRYIKIAARLALQSSSGQRDQERSEMVQVLGEKFGDDLSVAVSQIFSGVCAVALFRLCLF